MKNSILETVTKAHNEYRLGLIVHLSDSDLQALAQCRGVRPCVANEKPAKFIRWLYREWSYSPITVGGSASRESGMFAFVEFEDGTMGNIPSDKVRFTDV